MLKTFRRAAVRAVKPRVSEETWAKLREIDPQRITTRLRPSLGSLATRYESQTAGSRRYAAHYQRHFNQQRDTGFTLLQIGIGRDGADGSALRMWKHFFPKAQIVGVDLDDKSFVNEKRISTYQGSQVDADLLRSIARKHHHLKIIIDNGSHRPEHTRATFAILFPLLADGGYYAIENTRTAYWPTLGGSVDLMSRATTMSMIKDLLDGLNYREFGDHRPRCYTDSHVVAVHCYHDLVIIEKGYNATDVP
jgi:demethylmacrocin O-methyltransferase